MTTPYHAGLRDDHVYWYIKLIPRHLADELHVESQTGRSDVLGQVLDDSVKVSPSPAQSVAFTVPDHALNKDHIHSIKADRLNVRRSRHKNGERDARQFAAEFVH